MSDSKLNKKTQLPTYGVADIDGLQSALNAKMSASPIDNKRYLLYNGSMIEFNNPVTVDLTSQIDGVTKTFASGLTGIANKYSAIYHNGIFYPKNFGYTIDSNDNIVVTFTQAPEIGDTLYLVVSDYEGTAPTASIPQANSTVLGGIKAPARTTESTPVVIDTSTGLLYTTAVDSQARSDIQDLYDKIGDIEAALQAINGES